jgi:hypothetical protein
VAQEPSEIERQIEATRERLAVNIDALAERVNPRNVARRTAGDAREKFRATVRRLTGNQG